MDCSWWDNNNMHNYVPGGQISYLGCLEQLISNELTVVLAEHG